MTCWCHKKFRSDGESLLSLSVPMVWGSSEYINFKILSHQNQGFSSLKSSWNRLWAQFPCALYQMFPLLMTFQSVIKKFETVQTIHIHGTAPHYIIVVNKHTPQSNFFSRESGVQASDYWRIKGVRIICCAIRLIPTENRPPAIIVRKNMSM